MLTASPEVWNILYTVSRYLMPMFSFMLFVIALLYILSENRFRREKLSGLPGAGTVGELVVISGSHSLAVNTWYPVPREGVLGSIRSCDLFVPCAGVHAKHLDFSWEDGRGVIIHPRTGCEVLVDGVLVNCRSDAFSAPMVHGSILQIGSAVLRLHLFAALENTVAASRPQAEKAVSPEQLHSDMPANGFYGLYEPPVQSGDAVDAVFSPQTDGFSAPCSSEDLKLHRSDHWREDIGE